MVRVEEYEFPEGLSYSKDHTWAKVEGGRVRVGVTDFAQKLAGKILFARIRGVGVRVERGKSLGTMESSKWVGAVNAPVSGVIVEVNEKVKDNPSLLNQDPYGEGWMALIAPSKLEEDLGALMGPGEPLVSFIKSEIKERIPG